MSGNEIWQRHDETCSPARRLVALISLTAAMVLTGANVVLGKAIVAEVPVYLFMFYRFVVSTAALLPLVYRQAGPKLRQMRAGRFAISSAWRCWA